MGLFLHALRELVLQQNLGGWTKNGFGRFELAHATIRQSGPDGIEQSLFTAGLDKGEFNEDSPLVLDALDGWAEAASTLSAAEIEKLYELQED